MSRNRYPQAGGPRAHTAVRRAVLAFRRMPQEVRDRLPLIWLLLGDSTQHYKMAKAAAAYVDDARVGRAAIPQGEGDFQVAKIPPNQVCGNCRYAYRHVTSDVMICSWVRGAIRPTGWCRFWAPPMPAGKHKAGGYDPDHFPQE